MKKTTKMAICAALVVGANLFAPAMPASDYVALNIVAPANVAYAATDEELTTAYREYKKTMIENDPYTPDEYKPAQLAEVSEYTVSNGYVLKNGQKVETLSSVVATFVAQGQAEEVFEKYDVFQKMVNDYNNAELNTQINGTDGTGNTNGLAKDVSDLQTAVGDANSGLTKDVGDLKTSVGDANSGLTKEVNTLKSTVASLGSSGGASSTDLNNEITRSTAKDAEHDTKLADHKTRITSNTSRINTLESVTATHTAQIANHERRIDDLEDTAVDHERRITANTNAIVQEVKDRKAEVKRLDGRIDTETAERKAADIQLQKNIDAEAETRAKADNILAQAIDDEAATRAKAIDEEAKTRAEVDKILAESIVAESQMRASGEMFLNNKIDREVSRLDNKIDEVQSEARKGVAMAVATANLRMPSYDEQHKWGAAIGGGYYKGMNAISVGVFYQFNRDMNLSLSVSHCGGDFTVGYGYSMKL